MVNKQVISKAQQLTLWQPLTTQQQEIIKGGNGLTYRHGHPTRRG